MIRLLSDFDAAMNIMRDFWQGIGSGWLSVIVVILAAVALLLFLSLVKAAVGKTSVVIKWGRLLLLIIDIVLLVYFCLMY